MHLSLLPWLLFPAAGVLSALAAARLRSHGEPRWRMPAAVAVLSLLSTAYEVYSWWFPNAIRLDLFLTLPLVSAASAAAGIVARHRLPANGLALLVAGGVSLAWFTVAFVGSGREARRLTAIFDEANRLYWEESIRCEANFERRFGPLTSSGPCHGNLRTRSTSGYPHSGVVVNDDGVVSLLFATATGVEVPWGLLGDRPVAVVTNGVAPCDPEALCREVIFREAPAGGCQATVRMRTGGDVRLELERAGPLPACPRASTAVRHEGRFFEIFTENGPQSIRQLVQVWLWETADGGFGLLLNAQGYPGRTHPYQFVQRLRGGAPSGGVWDLAVLDLQNRPTGARLRLQMDAEGAAISGDAVRWVTRGSGRLRRGEAIRDPRIDLAPVDDAARFAAYFGAVWHNLSVAWTVE